MTRFFYIFEATKKLIHKNDGFLKIVAFFIYFISIFPRFLGFAIPLKDSFHHGEPFAAAVNIWYRSEVIPNTIHGGLDFIPALISRFFTSGDNYFYPTVYLTLIIFPAITGLIFLLFLRKICGENNNIKTTIFLCGASITAQYLFTIRELFLIATLFSLYNYLNNSSNKGINYDLSLLMLTTSVGCLWSFDRGLAGLSSVTLGLFVRSYFKKDIKYLKSLFIVLLSTLILILFTKFFGVINYFENIRFLVQTSSQWNYPWGERTLAAAGFLTLYVIFCIFITGKKYFINASPEMKSFWVAISFCSLFMLRIAINRIDIGHAYAALWVPLITSAFLFKCDKLIDSSKNILLATTACLIGLSIFKFSDKNPFTFLGLNILYLTFCLVTLCTFLVWTGTFQKFQSPRKILLFFSSLMLSLLILVSLNQYRFWFSVRFQPDWLITPIEHFKKGITYSEIFPDTNWVTNQIRESDSKCLLDMTNSGTINAGVDIPSCFSIPYPVYATSKFQKRLIEEAKISKVSKIVYSTKYWQYNIDGKDMVYRFPKLNQFLIKRFPIEECKDNYCIRKTTLDYNFQDK